MDGLRQTEIHDPMLGGLRRSVAAILCTMWAAGSILPILWCAGVPYVIGLDADVSVALIFAGLITIFIGVTAPRNAAIRTVVFRDHAGVPLACRRLLVGGLIPLAYGLAFAALGAFDTSETTFPK